MDCHGLRWATLGRASVPSDPASCRGSAALVRPPVHSGPGATGRSACQPIPVSGAAPDPSSPAWAAKIEV